MGGWIRLLTAACIAGATLAGSAMAGIPDPSNSNIPHVIYDPSGAIPYTVSIRDVNDSPVEGARVELMFSTETNGLVAWCPGQASSRIGPVVTDVNGLATFFIAAGGCLDPDEFSSPPVQVLVDGVLLAEVGAVSPDAVDGNSVYPWQGWDPQGLVTVGLSDATIHTPPIKTATYSFCTDFDSDGLISLADAVFVTAPVKNGNTCSP